MTTVLCRFVNRICSTGWARRLLSTPTAENQTDIEGYFRRQREGRASFLDEFGAEADLRGERVLDLGCGVGARTLAVARAGAAEVVGVDTDPEKVRRAREEADRSSADGILYAAQSGSTLGFVEGRFDVVLLLDVVEHLADPAAVLAECARVLRSGGRVLVGFPPYRSPWGGHLFTHVPIPWAQLIFPDREVLDLWRDIHARSVARGELRCSARRARAIIGAETTAALWDCNGMTIQRFLDLVDRAPLELKALKFKTLGSREGSVARMPRLREYLVTRAVAVLVA